MLSFTGIYWSLGYNKSGCFDSWQQVTGQCWWSDFSLGFPRCSGLAGLSTSCSGVSLELVWFLCVYRVHLSWMWKWLHLHALMKWKDDLFMKHKFHVK